MSFADRDTEAVSHRHRAGRGRDRRTSEEDQRDRSRYPSKHSGHRAEARSILRYERRVLAESSGPLRHGDRTEPSRRHARADHATGELTYRRCLPSRLGSYRGLHQGRDRVGLSDQSVDRSDAPFVTSASARPANVSTNALRCSAVTGYGLATASSPSLLVPAYGMAIGGSSKTFTTLSGPIGRLIPISGREGPRRAGFYCVPNW